MARHMTLVSPASLWLFFGRTGVVHKLREAGDRFSHIGRNIRSNFRRDADEYAMILCVSSYTQHFVEMGHTASSVCLRFCQEISTVLM